MNFATPRAAFAVALVAVLVVVGSTYALGREVLDVPATPVVAAPVPAEAPPAPTASATPLVLPPTQTPVIIVVTAAPQPTVRPTFGPPAFIPTITPTFTPTFIVYGAPLPTRTVTALPAGEIVRPPATIFVPPANLETVTFLQALSVDEVLISRQNSEVLLLQYGIGCLSLSLMFQGQTFLVDSPSFLFGGIGSKIVISGRGQTCSIWSVDDVDRVVFQAGVDFNHIIVVGPYGQRWLLEYGAGCSSLGPYFTGGPLYIHSPGLFSGVSSRILIPNRSQDCRIWNSTQL